MFDISALKEMKLSELQEIAKLAKTIKFNGVKKETLISQILAHQETTATPPAPPVADKEMADDKPKRARIVPAKKTTVSKEAPVLEFDKVEETPEKKVTPIAAKQKNQTNPKAQPAAKVEETTENPGTDNKEPKIVKFNKSAYEKKVALQKEKEAVKDTVKEVIAEESAEITAPIAEKAETAPQGKKINPNQNKNQNPNHKNKKNSNNFRPVS